MYTKVYSHHVDKEENLILWISRTEYKKHFTNINQDLRSGRR